MKKIQISFATNDPDTGMNTNYASAFQVGLEMLHLEVVRGRDVRVITLPHKRIRIGRRIFPYLAYTRWLGNWCWDGILVDDQTAQAIVEYLRSLKRLEPDEGWTEAWKLWDSDQPFNFEKLSQVP